jgi:hypothetical protein
VVNDLERKDRGISIAFQSYPRYPPMNLFNNMAFGLKFAKKPKEFISEILGKSSKLLGLDHVPERKPGALSVFQCEDTMASTADFSAEGSSSQAEMTFCKSVSKTKSGFCEALCESCFASS